MVESDSSFRDSFTTLCNFYRPRCRYTALIETPDGYTYPQPYNEIEDLINLCDSLGDGYSIAEIF